MKKNRIAFLVASMCCAASGNVLAQAAASEAAPAVKSAALPAPVVNQASGTGYESSGIPVATTRTPNAIRLGNVFVTPSLVTAYGYDSNLNAAPDDLQLESNVFSVRPEVSAEIEKQGDRYALTYGGEFNRYFSSSVDNSNNHRFDLTGENVFTSRSSLQWQAAYVDRFEPRADSTASTQSATPNHFTGISASALYRYGAEGAKGRIDIEGGVGQKEFVNNRATTVFLDNASANLAGRFYYRVGARTQAFVEYRQTEFDYEIDVGNNLDNVERRYLGGLTWEVTDATTGYVKVGQMTKDFKTGSRQSFAGLSWEASMNWKPLLRSEFVFVSGRAAVDPSDVNIDYLLTRTNTLTWNHAWSSFVRTSTGVEHQRTTYSGSGRRDALLIGRLGVTYDFRRWLGLGLSYSYALRNSNDADFDYRRRQVLLNVASTF